MEPNTPHHLEKRINMKTNVFAIFAILSFGILPGCAPVKPVTLPGGEPGLRILCRGIFSPEKKCAELAAQNCAEGYKVVDKQEITPPSTSKPATVKSGGFSLSVSPDLVESYKWLVQCE
ncbi:MAG: hypothetical protein OXB87_01550 [Hyphomicrobiales bacterium]|nr:hypothetical protein [Hyphomicrobiales bacterium]